MVQENAAVSEESFSGNSVMGRTPLGESTHLNAINVRNRLVNKRAGS
jgi:hypothetical protein